MTSAPARAAAGFARSYGGAPDGVWAAPGRVNLIGEHTDYNGGLALPIALPWRTYAAVRARDDDRVRVGSERMPGRPAALALRQVRPGHPGDWTAYVVGVVWALRQAGHGVPGIDAYLTSDVPIGAGLSSSAALECAVAAALSDLAGLGLLGDDRGRAALADACQHAENDIVGVPTGGLDQAASLRCRAGHALLLDFRDGRAEHLPVDLDAGGAALVLVDTRVTRALVDGRYAERRQACEGAARALGVASLRAVTGGSLASALARLPDERTRARVRHVVTETQRVQACVQVLRVGDLAAVGRLMLASHVSLREDYEVSCPELDLAVEAAMRAGALGARMTGGGFGGSAIALVPTAATATVAASVERAFAERGLAPPHSRVVTPSAGAARVR
ncbi:MAG: galactokinase [Dermatophilaceae bacterium]